MHSNGTKSTDTTWQLIAFDLDDTLAPSKSPLPNEMGSALRRLLDRFQVAVISGGAMPQFRMQLLDGLNASTDQLSNLHLLPTCGTQYLVFDDCLPREVYAHHLPKSVRIKVKSVLEDEAKRLGLWEPSPWGAAIEDRGSQVTFSALGQNAPLDQKRQWDPTGTKKAALREAVALRLPELEVRSGGSTSIDITARGIDKAHGMRQLQSATGISKDKMLFIGDRLDPNGNDYPVLADGWPTLAVDGWEHTVRVINEILDDPDSARC